MKVIYRKLEFDFTTGEPLFAYDGVPGYWWTASFTNKSAKQINHGAIATRACDASPSTERRRQQRKRSFPL